MEGPSGGVGVRRAESANLRDLLGFKSEESDSNGGDNERHNYNNNNRNLVGLTLGAVLSGEMRSMSMPVRSNRTLLDIIRDEPLGKNLRDEKRRWRLLKQKLKLGRARTGLGLGLTPSGPVPSSNNNNESNSSRVMTRLHSADVLPDPGGSVQRADEEASLSTPLSSVMMRSSSAAVLERNPSQQVVQSGERGSAGGLEGGEAQGAREESREGGGEEEQPARMSLMALLEETDRQTGLDGPAYTMNDDDDGEDEERVEMDVFLDAEQDLGGGEVEGAAVGITNRCCVCMVRHKGAAFIPCGHTFCRLCSRELWVRRGNCPLCNNSILEILDIF